MNKHYRTTLALIAAIVFAVLAYRSSGTERLVCASTGIILWGIAMVLDALTEWRRM